MFSLATLVIRANAQVQESQGVDERLDPQQCEVQCHVQLHGHYL